MLKRRLFLLFFLVLLTILCVSQGRIMFEENHHKKFSPEALIKEMPGLLVIAKSTAVRISIPMRRSCSLHFFTAIQPVIGAGQPPEHTYGRRKTSRELF